MYLCIFPYPCKSNLAQDAIFKSCSLRLVSNRTFAVFSQVSSFGLLWLVVRHFSFVLVLWCGVRLFALWIDMVQNYWTHDRRFGRRRYADEHDNAMNLSEWLPEPLIQRQPAEQSSSFPKLFVHEPRLNRIRLRLSDSTCDESNEISKADAFRGAIAGRH